jgi:hypothetical protein
MGNPYCSCTLTRVRSRCSSGEFYTAVTVALIFIVLIPLGVPIAFLFFMNKRRTELGGSVNANAFGGAKLVSDDTPDDADPYSYLIKDQKPEYWYYEIVTYSRKLLLGGVAVFVGRGTLAQIYFVITAESFYLMHHMRTYPYVSPKHNIIDALGHGILILTYAACLILRYGDDDVTFQDESFPREGCERALASLFALPRPSFPRQCLTLRSDR